MPHRGRPISLGLLAFLLVSAVCCGEPGPSATPVPTPDPVRPAATVYRWSELADVPFVRRCAAAVTLLDGTVLMTGGDDGVYGFSNTELFDPRTERWSRAAPMREPRTLHTATVLTDGRVLVTGGGLPCGSSCFVGAKDSTEIFDPDSGTWSSAAPMPWATRGHHAVRLRDGSVLVVPAQGWHGTSYGKVAARYRPDEDRWVPTGPLVSTHVRGGLVALADGRALATGEYLGPNTRAAELFDPATQTWRATAPMLAERFAPDMVVMRDGRVLVMGGESLTASKTTPEIFDPVREEWTEAGDRIPLLDGHEAVVLDNGDVLVVGQNVATRGAMAVLFRPSTGEWSTQDAPVGARAFGHVLIPLSGQRALLAFGDRSAGWGLPAYLVPGAALWEPVSTSP